MPSEWVLRKYKIAYLYLYIYIIWKQFWFKKTATAISRYIYIYIYIKNWINKIKVELSSESIRKKENFYQLIKLTKILIAWLRVNQHKVAFSLCILRKFNAAAKFKINSPLLSVLFVVCAHKAPSSFLYKFDAMLQCLYIHIYLERVKVVELQWLMLPVRFKTDLSAIRFNQNILLMTFKNQKFKYTYIFMFAFVFLLSWHSGHEASYFLFGLV